MYVVVFIAFRFSVLFLFDHAQLHVFFEDREGHRLVSFMCLICIFSRVSVGEPCCRLACPWEIWRLMYARMIIFDLNVLIHKPQWQCLKSYICLIGEKSPPYLQVWGPRYEFTLHFELRALFPRPFTHLDPQQPSQPVFPLVNCVPKLPSSCVV